MFNAVYDNDSLDMLLKLPGVIRSLIKYCIIVVNRMYETEASTPTVVDRR